MNENYIGATLMIWFANTIIYVFSYDSEGLAFSIFNSSKFKRILGYLSIFACLPLIVVLVPKIRQWLKDIYKESI